MKKINYLGEYWKNSVIFLQHNLRVHRKRMQNRTTIPYSAKPTNPWSGINPQMRPNIMAKIWRPQ